MVLICYHRWGGRGGGVCIELLQDALFNVGAS